MAGDFKTRTFNEVFLPVYTSRTRQDSHWYTNTSAQEQPGQHTIVMPLGDALLQFIPEKDTCINIRRKHQEELLIEEL